MKTAPVTPRRAASGGLSAQSPVAALVLFVISVLATADDDPRVVIYYPDIREPYRTIFMDIIKGIESELDLEATKYALKKKQQPPTFVKADNPVIIALGKRGVNAAHGTTHPVVLGAVNLRPNQIPENFGGVLVEPDPAVMFGKLRHLAPQTRRIHVVSHTDRSDWLLARARVAAERHGFKLTSYAAADLSEVANHYRYIFSTTRANEDVIWLMEAAFSRDKAIINSILEEAWNNNALVITSNPGHVKRGALFGFYPDNRAMGVRLGAIAKRKLNGEDLPEVSLLGDLLLALNQRTADHLGLKFPKTEKFDLIYPPR